MTTQFSQSASASALFGLVSVRSFLALLVLVRIRTSYILFALFLLFLSSVSVLMGVDLAHIAHSR